MTLRSCIPVGMCLVFVSLLAACVSDREKELAARNVLFPASSSSSSDRESSAVSAGDKHPCSRKDFLPSAEEEWRDSWNDDAATTTVTMTSEEKGFTTEIPHNPDWGNYECFLSPYDENDKEVLFGFAGVFEGGGAMRFNRIDVIPVRDEAAALASADKMVKDDMPASGLPPTVSTINGNTVVTYSLSGFCGWTFHEVLGKTWNYVFSSTCDTDVEGVEAALRTLQID